MPVALPEPDVERDGIPLWLWEFRRESVLDRQSRIEHRLDGNPALIALF